MRTRSGFLILVAASACGGAAPHASTPASPAPTATATPALGPEWAAFRAIAGSWAGDGGDAAHPSRGTFVLAPDLGGKVLVRRGTNDSAQAHHEDLTIIYRGAAGALEAQYFDNEGHTIHYAVVPSDDGHHVVFTSDEVAGAPRFRLTYDLGADGALAITFEVAPPGGAFQAYVHGVVHRTP